MAQGDQSTRALRSRRLVRLAALAMMLAFLVGQSSMLCAPLCLLEGHAVMAMSSPDANHGMPCHSSKVVASPPAVAGLLATMLPSQATPQLPSLRLLAIRFAPPASGQLYQLPAQDPPPPRSV
jgi:hypothetical protein